MEGEGWRETELGAWGWPWLTTAQQGCAGGLVLCPTTEGQLLLSFPGGCAGFPAPLHLGTLSADGASEVSSALPSPNAASSPGLILWGQGCVVYAEPEVGQGSCPPDLDVLCPLGSGFCVTLHMGVGA